MENKNNKIVVAGKFEKEPEFSHEVTGNAFYKSVFFVKRASGAFDRIPVIIPRKFIDTQEIDINKLMLICGQIRSYNKVIDGKCRLIVQIFAQSISYEYGMDTRNDVEITGVLCKNPTYRYTPFGREICDMMIAVNRAFGRNDYIPCIAWGSIARKAKNLKPGDKIKIGGRLQSREYEKVLKSGDTEKRATIELSVFSMQKLNEMEED